MKESTKFFLFPIETDPVKWAGQIVGSWTKFLIAAGLLSYVTYSLVMRVAERGVDRAVYAALVLIIYQLTILYGLRWLYLVVAKKKSD